MALCLAFTRQRLLSSGSAAEELDAKTGKLGHLAPLIGTYRLDDVLQDDNVRAALSTLLPAATLTVLEDNLGVAGPIDFIEGHLVLSGNKPHYGLEETAQLWVRLYDGKVNVVLRERGAVTLYAAESQYDYLPLTLRQGLAAPAVPALRNPPAGVTWRNPSETATSTRSSGAR